MPPVFRRAVPNDADAIIRFQIAMALETERLRLDPPTCAMGVRAVFEDPSKGTYHVCELEGRVVGSLLIVPEWSDWRNGTVWWIHSVFVEPDSRGKGIYSGLYRHVRNLVDADPTLRGLRLYVDKRNTHAQKVYSRLQMTDEHYNLFEWMKVPQ